MFEWLSTHPLILAIAAVIVIASRALTRLVREVLIPFLAIFAPRRIRKAARRVLQILHRSREAKMRDHRQIEPPKRCKPRRRRRRTGQGHRRRPKRKQRPRCLAF